MRGVLVPARFARMSVCVCVDPGESCSLIRLGRPGERGTACMPPRLPDCRSPLERNDLSRTESVVKHRRDMMINERKLDLYP